MSCNTYNPITDCTLSVGGISKVWIFPFGSLYDFEYNNDNLNYIADYKINNLGVAINVQNPSTLSESVEKGNTDTFTYNLNLTIQKLEWEKRAELVKIIKGKLTFIVRDKNGKCWIIGKDTPVRVTSYNATTGASGEESLYELSFTNFSKEPFKEIRCYDDTCAVSVQGTESFQSYFLITSASTFDFTGEYDLLGNTITREGTPLTPLDPTNWTNPAILAADTAFIQSIANPNGNTVVQLAYNIGTDEALIILYSSDTQYPFLSIGANPFIGQVDITVNLVTTFSTLLTNVNIEVEDETPSVIYSEAPGDAVTGVGLSGIAENSFINVSQLYPLGQTFTVNVTFDETECGVSSYTYVYEPSNECQLINNYSVHNGKHYSVEVDYVGGAYKYGETQIVIGERQFLLYPDYNLYHSSDSQLESDILSIFSNYPDLNISNVSVTFSPKSYWITFDAADDNLDFYVYTRGDSQTSLSTADNFIRKWSSKRSIILALQTAAPSDSVLTIQNTVNGAVIDGNYGAYPTSVLNGRLEEVPPFTNNVTNSIGIDMVFDANGVDTNEWLETDTIDISNQSLICPDVINNITIDTCLDGFGEESTERYYRYALDVSDELTSDIGNSIEFDLSTGSIFAYSALPITDTNYSDIGDNLASEANITLLNIQFDRALLSYFIEFTVPSTITVNGLNSGSFVWALMEDYDIINVSLDNKQHPDIDLYWEIDTAKGNEIFTGKVRDAINIDDKNEKLIADFIYDLPDDFTINFVTNKDLTGQWTVEFFNSFPTGSPVFSFSVATPTLTTTITNFSTNFAPLTDVRYIRLRNDLGYETIVPWNPNTQSLVSVQINTYNLYKTVWGRFDDWKCISNTSTSTGLILVRSSTNCPSIDIDVENFLSATGITDPVIEGALTVFVATMKVNGLWSLFDAIYPFVGGTATTHKFNLVNPADSNTAFRLTFSGGWTHSSTGITGNAINTFANTWYDDGIYALDNDHHISIYNRTNNHLQYCDMGNYDGVANSTNIFTRNPIGAGNRTYYRNQSGINGFFVDLDARGWRCSNRVGSTEIRGAVNGTLQIVPEVFTTRTTGRPYYIGALNQISLAFVSNREYAFATIGKGLTDAQMVILYNAIQAFQTALSRQV